MSNKALTAFLKKNHSCIKAGHFVNNYVVTKMKSYFFIIINPAF